MRELINITDNEGTLVVSSRQVAEDFDKRHANVIEKIEELIKTENSVMTMFIESSYKAESLSKQNCLVENMKIIMKSEILKI